MMSFPVMKLGLRYVMVKLNGLISLIKIPMNLLFIDDLCLSLDEEKEAKLFIMPAFVM